jgi:hypothetical protein
MYIWLYACLPQVYAEGAVTCAVMRSADFERLLGPYEDVWRFEVLRKVCVACS